MTLAILNRFPLALVDYPAWIDDDIVMVTSRDALSQVFDLSPFKDVVVVDDYTSARTMVLMDHVGKFFHRREVTQVAFIAVVGEVEPFI